MKKKGFTIRSDLLLTHQMTTPVFWLWKVSLSTKKKKESQTYKNNNAAIQKLGGERGSAAAPTSRLNVTN
jgi:hypothetical protein